MFGIRSLGKGSTTKMDETPNGGFSAISLLKRDRAATSCKLFETLEKDVSLIIRVSIDRLTVNLPSSADKTKVAVLRIEARHGSRISSELENKLEWLSRVTDTLSGKLDSLRCLADLNSRSCNDARSFADQIAASWEVAKKQVCEEYGKIRVASRTSSGIPLSTLLGKIRERAIAVRLSIRARDVARGEGYASGDQVVFEEITSLLEDLARCDEKVQQYLAVCKITPHLLLLESAIDAYVASNEMLPARLRDASYAVVFSILASLLTEELLGRDPVDPDRVLATNAPRKPVFITKNSKRKPDVADPTASVKIPKHSHLSAFL